MVSKMLLKVKVTQNHIDEGNPSSLRSCPIALAMNSLKGVQFSDVDKEQCFIVKPNVTWPDWDEESAISDEGYVTKPIWKGPLPPEAQKFVADFDEGKDVKPFEFEVELKRTTLDFCEDGDQSR